MHISEFSKAKLTVGSGWQVSWHQLYEIDPDSANLISGFPDGYTIWDGFFGEDLLQIVNESSGLLLDVGWYPSKSESGRYVCVLVCRVPDQVNPEGRFDWEHPIKQFESRNVGDVVAFVSDNCV